MSAKPLLNIASILICFSLATVSSGSAQSASVQDPRPQESQEQSGRARKRISRPGKTMPRFMRRESREAFLEKHPKLEAKVKEWQSLTQDERRARVQQKLAEAPKAQEVMTRHPKAADVARERPRMMLRAIRSPEQFEKRMVRLERFLEKHPDAVDRMKSRLEARRTKLRR